MGNSVQSLLNEIKQKKFGSIYFLEGDEVFFIDQVANALEDNVLTEAEKGFNYQVFYGKESNMLDVTSACKRYPMMSNKQLIIVREAQFLRGLATDKHFLDYLLNPLDSTVLVILFKGKKVSKATKVGKALKKHKVLTAAKMYDNQLLAWLNNYLVSLKIEMEEQAKLIIIEQAGNNLSGLASEIQKLKVSIKNNTITVKDMELLSGLSRSYNVFEFQRALGQRNFEKSMKIANYFGRDSKSHPFVLILSSIFNYFKKVHALHYLGGQNANELAGQIGVSPYFVNEYVSAASKYNVEKMKDIFNLLGEFDRKSKGIEAGNSKENELLQEMTARIVI